ncbi:MAG TPA: DMT family transporter [Methylomirabilota bacterium]|jgi:drug/metabolite transporter (DMT)-like permease|nr:DMT family transporter [Methylomirabilota bacterium]
MSPIALLLVLLAALCHSAWNLIVKTDARRLEIQSGALVVGTLLCAPVLLFHSPWTLSPLAWAAVAVSALFESAYVLALTSAYAAGDMSLVYPVARGTGTVLVAPLAVLLLGERPSLQGAVGIGLVVVGIFLSHGALSGWAAARAHRRALGWALLTGALIAGYSLVNKVGVTLVPVPLYAFLVFLADAALVRLVQRWRGGSVPALRRDAPWGRIVAVGVLMMGAYLAVLIAMSQAPVSYVVATREISVVVAALLGALVLHERHSAARVAGAVVIFGGLCAIALAR